MPAKATRLLGATPPKPNTRPGITIGAANAVPAAAAPAKNCRPGNSHFVKGHRKSPAIAVGRGLRLIRWEHRSREEKDAV